MTDGRSDVLVIGAGPAGCAAAIEAARAGAGVCVVDRARFPRPKTCGDAISNEAARAVVELGAGAGFDAAPRAPVLGATAVFPDGSRVGRSYGDAPGYICERRSFDHVLRAALDALGVRVVEGAHVRELVRKGARRVEARADGWRWSADAVVAADGHGSMAWSTLGETRPPPATMGIAITAYYSRMRPGPDRGHSEHFFRHDLPCGYAWIFPDVEGVANVGVYLRLDRYRAQGIKLRDLLERFVGDHPERFAEARREGASRTWSLPLARWHAPPAGENLLACGDAGRLIDPLTGEGIWQALASGRIAGRLTAQALGRDGGVQRLAQRFRWECARSVAWPTGARAGIQRAMHEIVERRLYESPAVRRLLEAGYRARALEVSKSVG